MKVRTALCLCLLGCFLLAAPASSLAQTKSHRIVISVTSATESDWKLVLANVRNVIAGYAPDTAEIEVVVFGPGMKMLVTSSIVDADIQALEAKQVRFVACESSMRFEHLTLSNLVKGVQSVPSGVIELVSRQEQGWSYIKGGS